MSTSDSPFETDERRRGDVDDVRRQVLGGHLERDPRPGRRLVEQDRHLAAAQGRDLGDGPGQDLAHRVGRAHHEIQVRGGQAVDVEQVAMTPADRLGLGRHVDRRDDDVGGVRPARPSTIAHPTGSAAAGSSTTRSISTPSSPSVSSRWTRTSSSRDVGTFLPTWSARIGQLAMAAIDQDREADRLRPPEVDERVHRGPDRASGVQDVVDEDDRAAVDARRAAPCP